MREAIRRASCRAIDPLPLVSALPSGVELSPFLCDAACLRQLEIRTEQVDTASQWGRVCAAAPWPIVCVCVCVCVV